MTAPAPTTAPPVVAMRAARCRECDAQIVWTLRAGKKLALDAKPIEVVPYDPNLVDAVVNRALLEQVYTDTGDVVRGWRVPAEVRPDLRRVSGRMGHWGNCWPNDGLAKAEQLARRERLDEQRGVAGVRGEP